MEIKKVNYWVAIPMRLFGKLVEIKHMKGVPVDEQIVSAVSEWIDMLERSETVLANRLALNN